MRKHKKIQMGEYKTVFQGLKYTIKQADAILPDGKKKKYEIMERGPSVMILAFNDKKELVLIREYRVRINKYVWSLPAGTVNKGERPLSAAKRELREESGYQAKKFRLFFYAEGGKSWSWKRYFYLAEGLIIDPLPQDDDEYIKEVITLPIEKAFEMAKANEIHNENMAYMICRLYFDQAKWL